MIFAGSNRFVFIFCEIVNLVNKLKAEVVICAIKISRDAGPKCPVDNVHLDRSQVILHYLFTTRQSWSTFCWLMFELNSEN